MCLTAHSDNARAALSRRRRPHFNARECPLHFTTHAFIAPTVAPTVDDHARALNPRLDMSLAVRDASTTDTQSRKPPPSQLAMTPSAAPQPRGRQSSTARALGATSINDPSRFEMRSFSRTTVLSAPSAGGTLHNLRAETGACNVSDVENRRANDARTTT